MNSEPDREYTVKICLLSAEKAKPSYLGGSTLRPHPMRTIATPAQKLIVAVPECMFTLLLRRFSNRAEHSVSRLSGTFPAATRTGAKRRHLNTTLSARSDTYDTPTFSGDTALYC